MRRVGVGVYHLNSISGEHHVKMRLNSIECAFRDIARRLRGAQEFNDLSSKDHRHVDPLVDRPR